MPCRGAEGPAPIAYFRKFPGPDFPKWFVDYPQGDHLIAGMPMYDGLNTMQTFLQRLVKDRQEVSIHTVEEGTSVAERLAGSGPGHRARILEGR